MGAPFTIESIINLYNRVEIVETLKPFINDSLRDIGRGHHVGDCPFCQTDQEALASSAQKPMFYVDEIHNSYDCHSCGSGGDAIAFLMQYKNQSYAQALEDLATIEGISLENETLTTQQLSDAMVMDVATEYYKLHTDKIRPYLHSKGFDDETIDAFDVGFAPKKSFGLIGFVESRTNANLFDIQQALFRQVMLKVDKKYLDAITNQDGVVDKEAIDFSDNFIFYETFYGGRIMFPLRETSGTVVGFSARWLDEDLMSDKPPRGTPKYVNTAEKEPIFGKNTLFKKRTFVYGLRQSMEEIRKNKKVNIVEGYTDAMAVYQANKTLPAQDRVMPVAIGGTAFGIHKARVLARHADYFNFIFDGDNAGVDAVKKELQAAMYVNVPATITLLPGNSDPHSFLQDNNFSWDAITSLPVHDAASLFIGAAKKKRALAIMENMPQSKEAPDKQFAKIFEEFSTRDRYEIAKEVITHYYDWATDKSLVYALIQDLAPKLALPTEAFVELYRENLLQRRNKYPDFRRVTEKGTRKINIQMNPYNLLVGDQFLCHVLCADQPMVDEVLQRVPIDSSALSTQQQQVYKHIVAEKSRATNGFLANPSKYGKWEKYSNGGSVHQQGLFTGSSVSEEVIKFFQDAKRKGELKIYPSAMIKLINAPPQKSLTTAVKLLEHRQIQTTIDNHFERLEAQVALGVLGDTPKEDIITEIERLYVLGVEQLPS